MANFAYLVGSRSTREALIVDPAWNVDALLDQAEADGMKVVGALVTHYHQDHVGGSIFGMNIEGVDRLLARQPMPIYVNEHEAEGTQAASRARPSPTSSRKRGGDAIELGGVRVRLLHTPGHTPGSQCFLVEEAGPARAGSSRATRSSSAAAAASTCPAAIPRRCTTACNGTLKRLPDETLLYPGHLYSAEPSTRWATRSARTRSCACASLDQFLMFMGA